MEFEKWIEKYNTPKLYAHFDHKNITIKSVLSEITNPQVIAKHSFMPFIHTELIFNKYSKNGRKSKTRDIYYSSHYDRCIYQYYAYRINECYNIKAMEFGINDIAIAYRNNFDHKSNINFAKKKSLPTI